MKRILVIYYTQTGQLKSIVDRILSTFNEEKNTEIVYEQLNPLPGYPFPWGKKFFDFFPESVKGIPCKLAPLSIDPESNFDLIILAYQPWFLSPSIPSSTFLQSEGARRLLFKKPVVTVIGARNMWTCAQEIVKKHLQKIGAHLVGNIVLIDRADNLIAAITILKWLIHGNKGPSGFLPEAGISQTDIQYSKNFGGIIAESLTSGDFSHLQHRLVEKEAVQLKFHLMKIEFTARQIFDKFAGFVLAAKFGSGRMKRIRLFKWYLLFVLFILSPFVSLVFRIQKILYSRAAKKRISYFKDVEIEAM